MHLSVEFNNFHWVAVRCEASGVSEATPTVAEASEASGSFLYTYSVGVLLHPVSLKVASGCK